MLDGENRFSRRKKSFCTCRGCWPPSTTAVFYRRWGVLEDKSRALNYNSTMIYCLRSPSRHNPRLRNPGIVIRGRPMWTETSEYIVFFISFPFISSFFDNYSCWVGFNNIGVKVKKPVVGMRAAEVIVGYPPPSSIPANGWVRYMMKPHRGLFVLLLLPPGLIIDKS